MIDLYVIKPATDVRIYSDTGGSWFVGGGVDMYSRSDNRQWNAHNTYLYKLMRDSSGHDNSPNYAMVK